MASRQHAMTQIGKRMKRSLDDASARPIDDDMPAIADLIRRIDMALMERRAA